VVDNGSVVLTQFTNSTALSFPQIETEILSHDFLYIHEA
jgi:hypothetical protein